MEDPNSRWVGLSWHVLGHHTFDMGLPHIANASRMEVSQLTLNPQGNPSMFLVCRPVQLSDFAISSVLSLREDFNESFLFEHSPRQWKNLWSPRVYIGCALALDANASGCDDVEAMGVPPKWS